MISYQNILYHRKNEIAVEYSLESKIKHLDISFKGKFKSWIILAFSNSETSIDSIELKLKLKKEFFETKPSFVSGILNFLQSDLDIKISNLPKDKISPKFLISFSKYFSRLYVCIVIAN